MRCSFAPLGALVFVLVVLVFLSSVWAHLFPAQAAPMWRRAVIASGVISLGREAKLIISFYQILTNMHTTYRVAFPSPFQALLGVLDIANGHVFAWIPGMSLQCVATDLAGQLAVIALVPLIVALLPLSLAALRGSVVDGLAYSLAILFLCFPSAANMGFRTLAPCRSFSQAAA